MSFQITPVTDGRPLTACTPSLMPFSISYTGPAPVSRYFRPRPAPPSLAALSLRSSSSVTVVASASSSSVLTETQSSRTAVSSTTSITHENECEDGLRSSIEVVNQVEQVAATRLALDTATEMESETQPALDAVQPEKLCGAQTSASRNVKRFVAAFRGRQMYGQGVDIPSEYGGLVLRASSDSKGEGKRDAEAASAPLSQKAMPKSKTRAATGRLKRATTHGTADQPTSGDDGDCCPDPDIDSPHQTRKLVPLSTFSSFMLWTPDRPLDEGRDEYARALVEWTRLAAEIHSYDE